MKKQHLKYLAVLLAMASTPNLADAADVLGGAGLGYIAKLVFNKTDAKNKSTVTIKTGDTVTPPGQDGYPITVPATKSMGWNDPASNPDEKTSDLNKAFGWGHNSKWFLIDLNTLQKQGVSSVWVKIAVKRYNDGVAVEYDAKGAALPSDDDLIPGLTVWSGYQSSGDGAQYNWFPNKFQGSVKPFWGAQLTPFTGTDNPGYATAYDLSDTSLAQITGKLKLKANGQNYLTVALGGDARDATKKHDVNFQLEVSVSTKKPSTTSPALGSIDQYGCTVGSTCWHPQMNHCMSVPACEDPQYKGQCLCPN